MIGPAASAIPYCGAAPAPGEILRHWNLDPFLIAALLAIALLWQLRAAGSKARGRAFWAGWFILFLAFVSPLCALSSGLFAARSVHHLLLVAMAAPLLGFALQTARRLPLGAATALHILIFWAWHVPAAYAAALSSDWVYWAMQLSLLGSGILFWSALFSGRGFAADIGALIAVIAQMGLLGALLTFAPQPLYAPHFLTTSLYGLTPLEDQQLAGLIMWVASLPFYMAAAIPVLARRLAPPLKAAA
jgi:putative membrane protein